MFWDVTPAAAYVPASWQNYNQSTFNTEWYIANRSIKTKRKCQVNVLKDIFESSK